MGTPKPAKSFNNVPMGYDGRPDRHVFVYPSYLWDNELVSLHVMATDNYRLLQKTKYLSQELVNLHSTFSRNWFNLRKAVHVSFACYRTFHKILAINGLKNYKISGTNNYHNLVIGPRPLYINKELFTLYLSTIVQQRKELCRFIVDRTLNSYPKHNDISKVVSRVNRALENLLHMDNNDVSFFRDMWNSDYFRK